MTLQEEIKIAKSMFLTDSYPMSVGELLFLYADKQLSLSNGQRYSCSQQNDLIESIFLDLPTQPIVVKQLSSGKWRILSGGWMLVAILNFLEKNEKDKLVLRATDLLASLYGLTWDNLSDREKFQFKRFQFVVHILAENTENTFCKDKVDSIFRRYSS